jgi:methyl-accepting chemotaxis protein-1 (serine sensor receptor)
MVADCNTLVDAHIQVKMRAISIMGRYAVGDLSQDMERLPGEKAVITEALDMAKHNLGAINGEIRRLAEAAAAGDFSQRGDSARFEHDFRAMVDGLNRLMQTTELNLGEVSSMLRAIADGRRRAHAR